MFPLFAIQILQQSSTSIVPFFSWSFFQQPIDILLYDLFVWFGWIPIFITLLWGFTEMWLYERQGKFASGLKFICLAVDVPALTEQSPKALENLFSTLYAAKSGITFKEKWFVGKLLPVFSFEIISEEGYIQFIIRTQIKFRDVIESGIYAQYPDAEVSEVTDYAIKLPSKYPDEKFDMWGGEFVLDKPSFFPIRTYVDFEDQMTGEIKDPLGYTLEQLSKMRPGEHFWFQMLIQPSSHDWRKEGITHVNKIYGVEEKHASNPWEGVMNSVFSVPFDAINHAIDVDFSTMFGITAADPHKKEVDPFKAFKLGPSQQDEAKAIMKKTVKVAHGTKIRILYVAEKPAFKKGDRATTVKGILNQYSHLNLNSFKLYGPVSPKDDYPWQLLSYAKKQNNLMQAYQSRSWGMGATPYFLNAEELATLWHFPTINIKAPLVKKAEARRAEPPVGLPVTFLENTLPGYHEESLDSVLPMYQKELSESRMHSENFATEKVDVSVPLPDALPTLIVPTDLVSPEKQTHAFLQDAPKKDQDDTNFYPPDLPV